MYRMGTNFFERLKEKKKIETMIGRLQIREQEMEKKA